MITVALCLSALALAQPGTSDPEEELVIPLHPGTPTTLQFSEEVVDARIRHRGEFLMEIVGQAVNLRPRPGILAGTEALVIVETSTMRKRFWLRVVERREDAVRRLVLPEVTALECTGAAWPEAPSVAPAAPVPPPILPGTPLLRLPETPPPLPGLPDPDRASGPERTGPAAGPADAAGRSPGAGEPVTPVDPVASVPGVELSLHAVVSLAGTTELTVPGYEAVHARQPHRAFGMRVAGRRRDRWWAVEASVLGEWLAAPTEHAPGDSTEGGSLRMSGPRLRADAGLRARFGTTLAPTVYAGIGLQVHHRNIEMLPRDEDKPIGANGDMPFGAALALGMGLEYRTGNVLLGLELHVRQGVPADYRSVAALLSVGFFLDQGT
jgi:hypothetical protein